MALLKGVGGAGVIDMAVGDEISLASGHRPSVVHQSVQLTAGSIAAACLVASHQISEQFC